MALKEDLSARLISAAFAARRHAYAPYSGFHVGAALLTESGEIFVGCNVENSAYSVTCCAERTALFAAIAQGHRKFTAIAVAGDSAHTPPCGVCLQALAEFNPCMEILLAADGGATETTSLESLLPRPFTPDHLLAEN